MCFFGNKSEIKVYLCKNLYLLKLDRIGGKIVSLYGAVIFAVADFD